MTAAVTEAWIRNPGIRSTGAENHPCHSQRDQQRFYLPPVEEGIALASAPLIWIAESDDAAHPEFLEEAVGALDSSCRDRNRILAIHCLSTANRRNCLLTSIAMTLPAKALPSMTPRTSSAKKNACEQPAVPQMQAPWFSTADCMKRSLPTSPGSGSAATGYAGHR